LKGKWRKQIPGCWCQQNNDKYTKEPSDAHKNILKEEILQEITENFVEKILDVVNQNVQDTLKKFQDTKNKEYEKTQ
jgi:hypothetical protein